MSRVSIEARDASAVSSAGLTIAAIMKTLHWIASAVIAAVSVHVGCAQQAADSPTRLGDSCDLAVVGAKESKSFLAFDAELRSALTKQDAVALAFLVEFPLRVNEAPQSGYSLNDAGALQRHFGQVFGSRVREAVLNSPVSSLMCRDQGVMYGGGEIWVSPTKLGYAVNVVNIESGDPGTSAADPKIRFLCQTEKHRIVIDEGPNKVVRYRS